MMEEMNKENEINEPQNEATESEATESDIVKSKPDVSVDIEEKNEVNRQYIISFILNPSLNASEVDRARIGLNEKIASHTGSVSTSICQEAPRNLAYPIGKTSQGYFCECAFEVDTEKLRDIDSEFKNDTDIIRHMIEVKYAPSKKQQKRRMRATQYKPQMEAAGVGKEGAKQQPETGLREKVSVEEIEKKIDEIIDNI